MKSLFASFVGISLAAGVPKSAGASDRCTIMYRLDATLQVSDTDFKKCDTTVEGIEGSLVLEFPRDEQGQPADGKVKVLHFSMYESFTIDSVVTVTTTIHHFTPSCNGFREPRWRRASDEGFPSQCKYTGNENAVAIGSLRKADRVIEWGGLSRGDNPQFDEFTQPLIHGPPGSDHSVTVSEDLSNIRTPVRRGDGHQSYNLPNDAPSRTWFSFVASRNDSSRFTTCARPGSTSVGGQTPGPRRSKRRTKSGESVDEGADR